MPVLYQYEFGNSQLDESTGELTINGLTVDIQPQSFRLLGLLLSRRGELVSHSEIEASVWHGRTLGANVLASAITRLRAALGEANAGLIEAVPRIGYRISIPVRRTVVGQFFSSALALAPGQELSMRPGFTLERMLGQGSNGEVWLANNAQTGIKRVFKIATGAQQLANLKREATLSRLLYAQLGERSNLLRILDWNFESPPFFIESEYGGENLLAWSQADGTLSVQSQISVIMLFLQIAHAVAAAHGVGVIHKDIKPANVLVNQQAGDWQLRLADFGSGRLTDHDRLAELGMTVMGEPTLMSDSVGGSAMYIAPEIFREQPATERSDVFALGVLLYQLLVGDLRRPMVPGWERDIGDALLIEEIAQATDGDPARRTAKVDTMIEHLVNLPARRQARQRQIAEQEQIQRDRNAARRAQARRPWVIGCLALMGTGLMASLYAYHTLRDSQTSLSRQYKNIEALNQFLTDDLIGQSNPSRTGRADVTIQEAAVLAAAKIDQPVFGYSPEVRAILHAAMQGNFDGLKNFKAEAAESEKALAALAQIPHADSEQLNTIRVMYANSLRNQTRLPDAAAQLDLVAQSIAQGEPVSAATQARYWFVRGLIARSYYRWAEARQDYVRALALLKGAEGSKTALREEIEYSEVQATRWQGDLATAADMARALRLQTIARYGEAHYLSCLATQGLGEILTAEHRFSESIPTLQTAYACVQHSAGADTIATARAGHSLAAGYFSNQQWADARDIYQRNLAIFERLAGKTALDTISTRSSIGRAYAFDGKPELALPFFLAALADARQVFGETHPTVQSIRFQLADCLLEIKQAQGVPELLAGLDPAQLNSINPSPSWPARLRYEQGKLALLNGDRQAAISLLESAARELEKNEQNEVDKRPNLYSSHHVRQHLAEARQH